MYVSVDAEKCIGCGVCVSACTARFMRLIYHARPKADEDRARMLAIAAQP